MARYKYRVRFGGRVVQVESDRPLSREEQIRAARTQLAMANLMRGEIDADTALQMMSRRGVSSPAAPTRPTGQPIPPLEVQQLPSNLQNQYRELGAFLASNANTVFSNARSFDEIERRIESYLPGDLRTWYQQQDPRTQIAFRRGLIRLIEAEHARRSGGFGSALWDAFIRPETLRPDYQRGGSITRQRHGAPVGTDEHAGQRNVGVIEGFGNLMTTPLRALTTSVIRSLFPNRTFGRESGTPTQATDWATTYAADPSWGSVLEAWMPNLPPFVRQIVGAGMNIVLDPANLIGIGAVNRATDTVQTLPVVGRAAQRASSVPIRAPQAVQKAAAKAQPVLKLVDDAYQAVKRKGNEALETAWITRKSDDPRILIKTIEKDDIPIQDFPKRFNERIKKETEEIVQNRTEQFFKGELDDFEEIYDPAKITEESDITRILGEFFEKTEEGKLVLKTPEAVIGKGAGNKEIVDAAYELLRGEIKEGVSVPKNVENKAYNLIYKALRSNDDKERIKLVRQASELLRPYREKPLLVEEDLITDVLLGELPVRVAEIKYTDPNLIERAVRFWKSTKTAYNLPAGATRNFVQNFIYRWLTGDVDEREIVRGIVNAARNPRRVVQIVRLLRGEVASDPQLASDLAKRLTATEPTTRLGKIDQWLRQTFGDADLAAAAIMGIGKVNPKKPNSPANFLYQLAEAERKAGFQGGFIRQLFGDPDEWLKKELFNLTREEAHRLVPDYTRVPTAIQDAARVGILPFGHWAYYAITGSLRGLSTHPSRWAKLIDAFTAGNANREDRGYERTDLPFSDREVRTEIIAPFELGAGSELSWWMAEQIPLVNLGLRLGRIRSQGESPIKEGVGFFAPPVLGYYLPNTLSELFATPEQKQFWSNYLPIQTDAWQGRRPRELSDYLLGIFGLPTRPQDPANDLANYYDRIYREATQSK